jgi:hypothetical protein
MSQGNFARHWTPEEDLKYYLFLILKSQVLHRKKQETKIYVEMSKFTMKTPTQCRSHHDKKIR